MDKKILKNIIENKLNIKVGDLKFIGGGSFGRVFKCTDIQSGITYVIKAYLTDGIAEREAQSLNYLARNKAVKIPKVYFMQTKKDEYDFDCLCMEYIEGKNALLNAGLLLAPKNTKRIFAEETINGLLSIHSITNENGKFGYLDCPDHDTWLSFYTPFAESIYKEALQANKNGKFDKHILDEMTQVYKKFDKIFDVDVTKPSLIHGDCNVMNIMVDKKYHVTAFIDPLNSIFADREYDIFQLQNLTGDCFDLYETYKLRYNVSDKCDIKCAFYGLWNEALVYLRTGTYTKFIMNSAIKRMKKQIGRI